jgi:hypothetical protein
MHCHREYSVEQIEDAIRELARRDAAEEGHLVPRSAKFLRIADILAHGGDEREERESSAEGAVSIPSPTSPLVEGASLASLGIRSITVSWKYP